MVVYSEKGFEKGTTKTPIFFTSRVSGGLLHEFTTAYLNNQRSGTHKTKTRGEVAFSGAKPWKQKGTGRARAGQKNSPLWRKGGVIFGPQPRDYYVKMSKRKKRLSLSMAFSVKFSGNNIVVVDSIKIDEVKTKRVVELIKNLKIEGKKILFITPTNNLNFKVASRNIKNVVVDNFNSINAYQVLWADKLAIDIEVISLLKRKSL
jgi:large subunit ribosomal protein L4